MDSRIIIVLITVPSQAVGREIGEALVDQKLAACVNIVTGLISIYRWKDEVIEDEEALLIVKTRSDLFEEQFEPAVKRIHPYEVPEIIGLPVIMGSKEYLDWIEEETSE